MAKAIRPSNKKVLEEQQRIRSAQEVGGGTNIFALPKEVAREGVLRTNVRRAEER
jgi:hypothetical protein